MIKDNYYYTKLPPRGKVIYDQLLNGIRNFEESIPVDASDMRDPLIDKAVNALMKDEPMLFYLGDKGYSIRCSTVTRGTVVNRSVSVQPEYVMSRQTAAEYTRRILHEVDKLITSLKLRGMSQRDTLRTLHDFMVTRGAYDKAATAENASIAQHVSAHSVIGYFYRYTAVCDGISETVKLILNTLDIRCIVVYGDGITSDGPGGHAWNIVRIGGSQAHLDMTWDMNLSSRYSPDYRYYCVPDSEIRKDHINFTDTPLCDTWSENYHYLTGSLVQGENELYEYLIREWKKGRKEISFRIHDPKAGSKNLSLYKQIAERAATRFVNTAYVNISYSCDPLFGDGRVIVNR